MKTAKNKSKKPILTPYKIMWLGIIPLKGKPTKKDQKLIEKELGMRVTNTGVSFLLHSASDTLAKKRLSILKKVKDIKRYKVYKFTDKQYGQSSKTGNTAFNTSLKVKLTEKQLKSVVYIGKALIKSKKAATKKSLAGTKSKTELKIVKFVDGAKNIFYVKVPTSVNSLIKTYVFKASDYDKTLQLAFFSSQAKQKAWLKENKLESYKMNDTGRVTDGKPKKGTHIYKLTELSKYKKK